MSSLVLLGLVAGGHSARAAVRLVASAPAAAKASRVLVSHILLDSEEMATSVVDSLNDGKATFEELAESLSACAHRRAPAQSSLHLFC